MKELAVKLEEFNQAIVQRIIDLMPLKGVKSKHNGEMVLQIQQEDYMRNIDGIHYSGYVTEITPTGLICNHGHQYSFDAIPIEDLCLAIDSIADQPSLFRVGTMDANGTMEQFKYFNDKDLAYEHFIDVRAKIIEGEHVSSEVWTENRVEVPNRHGEYEYETGESYNIDEDEDI